MKYKILFVDDEPGNLRLLERLFRRSYDVISASSGGEALKLLELHNVAVIVSDQRMPGMTGIQFLKRAADLRPQTVRIILTGYTDINDLVEVINSRVIYKYITKPWVNEDLIQTVVRGLEYYETFKDRHDLVQKNARLTEQLDVTRQGLLEIVSKALRSHDPSWPERCRRMTFSAVALGRWLEMTDEDVQDLSLATQLCEIGKLSDLANDQGSLEANVLSWTALLDGIPEMNDVAVAIRFQYERFDGTGFPDQLVGDQIPLFARILSIVTAYDQLIPVGVDEDASQTQRALEVLQEEMGGRFDPRLVDAFRVVQSIEIVPSVALHRTENWSGSLPFSNQ